MTIRDGSIADIGEIIRIYEGKEHFLSMIWSADPEKAKRFFVENLRNKAPLHSTDRNFRMLIAEDGGKTVGYLILFLRLVETITGEEQAFIFDYGVEAGHEEAAVPLIERAGGVTCEEGLKYLEVEIYNDDMKGELLYDSVGFRREIHRIIKIVEHHEFPFSESDPYKVRKAWNEDMFFLLWLNTQCASFTIPPGRDRKKEDVQFRYLRVYSGMKLEGDENLTALIIEDVRKDEPAGYLLLKTHAHDAITGEKLGYVYDIAIHPDYWGKRAAQRLMREGENALFQQNIKYCIADISDDNQRALKTAIKSTRFRAEKIRWMKKLK